MRCLLLNPVTVKHLNHTFFELSQMFLLIGFCALTAGPNGHGFSTHRSCQRMKTRKGVDPIWWHAYKTRDYPGMESHSSILRSPYNML